MNLCGTEIGLGENLETSTKVGVGAQVPNCGAADCATTHSVHFADSVPFKCRCAANSPADNSVDTKHNHAMRFASDRIPGSLDVSVDSKSNPRSTQSEV